MVAQVISILTQIYPATGLQSKIEPCSQPDRVWPHDLDSTLSP